MNCLYFKILDIFRITRKAESLYTAPRPWTSICCRLQGQSVFTTEKGSYHAGAGSILYLPGDITFHRQSTDEEMIILHLQCSNDTEDTQDIEIFYPDNILFAEHFIELYTHWNRKAPGYEHRCHALLHMILADLEENAALTSGSYKANLIQPGVLYLDTHFTDPEISIKKLAGLCNMSEEYFRRLYKELFGLSPCKAIADKRIQKACSLLQSGYFSIEEVATRSGFQNSKYFSTLFRKKIQISPLTYKKKWNTTGGEKNA